MEPVIEEKNNNILKIVIAVVVVLLFGGVGVFLFMQYSGNNSQQVQEQNSVDVNEGQGDMDNGTNGSAVEDEPMAVEDQEPTSTPAPTAIPETDPSKAWLQLSVDKESPVAAGDEIKVTVSAFSEGENVDAYDVLLSYDADLLEVVEVRSLSENFQVRDFIRSNFVSVTGYKPLSVEEESSFDETPILEYTIKAKASGNAEVLVLDKKAVETTKFSYGTADGNVSVMNPQVDVVTVSIE
jgi:hypothetical protein